MLDSRIFITHPPTPGLWAANASFPPGSLGTPHLAGAPFRALRSNNTRGTPRVPLRVCQQVRPASSRPVSRPPCYPTPPLWGLRVTHDPSPAKGSPSDEITRRWRTPLSALAENGPHARRRGFPFSRISPFRATSPCESDAPGPPPPPSIKGPRAGKESDLHTVTNHLACRGGAQRSEK